MIKGCNALALTRLLSSTSSTRLGRCMRGPTVPTRTRLQLLLAAHTGCLSLRHQNPAATTASHPASTLANACSQSLRSNPSASRGKAVNRTAQDTARRRRTPSSCITITATHQRQLAPPGASSSAITCLTTTASNSNSSDPRGGRHSSPLQQLEQPDAHQYQASSTTTPSAASGAGR